MGYNYLGLYDWQSDKNTRLLMRSLIVIIYTVIFAILTLPILLIMNLMYKKSPEKAERLARKHMCFYFRSLRFMAGTTLHVSGLEKVPDEPVLYIGNHRSYFDIIYTYIQNPRPTAYVAKIDLKKIPLFGLWGKVMGCLFFDRSNMRDALQMIKDGVNDIKNGVSVFIFPEGQRNKAKEQVPLLEFRNGSFKMAQRTGCPIIPVAIKNTADVWEGHMPWLKKCDVYITYGDPVYFSELSKEEQKEIGALMKNRIEEMLA